MTLTTPGAQHLTVVDVDRLVSGVILAFDADDGSSYYFLGTTKEAVLADTAGGTAFGFAKFTGWHPVALIDVHRHGFRYLGDALDNLVRALRERRPLSYLIGILDPRGRASEAGE